MIPQTAAVLLSAFDVLADEGTVVMSGSGVVLDAMPLAGAAELVRELKRRGVPVALVADGHVATFRNVLDDLFALLDAHAISEVVGFEKPHPRIFREALERLRVTPGDYARTLAVGPRLDRDVLGANRLGLVSVWSDVAPRWRKTPAGPSETPVHTIHSPTELLEIVR